MRGWGRGLLRLFAFNIVSTFGLLAASCAPLHPSSSGQASAADENVSQSTRDAIIGISSRLGHWPTVGDNQNALLVEDIRRILGIQDGSAEAPPLRLQTVPVEGDGRASVIIRVGDRWEAGMKGLTLSGHTDVVAAGEKEKWRQDDPFTFVQEKLPADEDKLLPKDEQGELHLFGRGAVDMKTAVATYLLLAKRLAAQWVQQRSDAAAAPIANCEVGMEQTRPTPEKWQVAIVLPWGEEVGSKGMAHALGAWDYDAWEPLPPHAIIGEPTVLIPLHATKGHMTGYFTFTSESPALLSSVSAEEQQAIATIAILDLQRKHSAEKQPFGELFPTAPITVYNPVSDYTIPDDKRASRALNVRPTEVRLGVAVRAIQDRTAERMVSEMSSVVQAKLRSVQAARGVAQDELGTTFTWTTIDGGGYFTFKGPGGHSSILETEMTAEEKQALATLAILELQRSYPLKDTDPPALIPLSNFTPPASGAAASLRTLGTQPTMVRLGVGVRVLPGQKPEEVAKRMTDEIRQKLPSQAIVEWAQVGFNPAFEVKKDHPFVVETETLAGTALPNTASGGAAAEAGMPPRTPAQTALYATDGGNLLTLLKKFHGEDEPAVVILGPGNINHAHLPNERIRLKQVWQYYNMLELAMATRVPNFVRQSPDAVDIGVAPKAP